VEVSGDGEEMKIKGRKKKQRKTKENGVKGRVKVWTLAIAPLI